MKLPQDQTKYSARFRYVEVGRYVDIQPKPKVIREKRGDKPLLIDVDEVPAYAAKHDNTGIYTSVLQYDSEYFDDATSLGSLYFDFDSNDLEVSRSETLQVVEYLLSHLPESAIRLYFSGGKGFHIECEPLALNISSADDTPGISRFIARHLTDEFQLVSTDFSVYDQRRMWRLPNSRHQRTGLFKVECLQLLRTSKDIADILEYAKEPHEYGVPEQTFSYSANAWFRDWSYQLEASKAFKPPAGDLLTSFLETGSAHNRWAQSSDEKVFDQFKLFKHCPAVRGLVAKAQTEHTLAHYERLFLCSILTYTPEAIEFLQSILANCHDYNREISTAHIEDWVKRREYEIGGRPFTCEKAKQMGINCSGCSAMEPRSKVVQLGDGKYVETGEYSAPSPVRWAYTIPKGTR